MLLPEICNGLASRLIATMGVNSAYGNAPNRLGALPCGVVFSDPDTPSTITMGQSEMWQHRLMPRLYIAPLKNIPNELEAAMPFVEAFVEAVRAKYQLGVAGVYGANVLSYRIGTADYGGVSYVVVEWQVEVKAKQNTRITL
jgi:hypothetical protein